MSGKNKALVHRWFEEVWNQGRADAIDTFLTSRTVVRDLGPADLDASGFKQFHAARTHGAVTLPG